MSLDSNITLLAQRIGSEVKDINLNIEQIKQIINIISQDFYSIDYGSIEDPVAEDLELL